MATSDAANDSSSSELVAAASGVTSTVGLVVVAVVLLDQLAFGIAIGALSGLGSYLLTGYLLRGAEGASREDNVVETFHRGALGFAASGSGVAALALLFVLEQPALALGGGIALATLEYLVLSQVLPREIDADASDAA